MSGIVQKYKTISSSLDLPDLVCSNVFFFKDHWWLAMSLSIKAIRRLLFGVGGCKERKPKKAASKGRQARDRFKMEDE